LACGVGGDGLASGETTKKGEENQMFYEVKTRAERLEERVLRLRGYL
jgi:hypothetical protein